MDSYTYSRRMLCTRPTLCWLSHFFSAMINHAFDLDIQHQLSLVFAIGSLILKFFWVSLYDMHLWWVSINWSYSMWVFQSDFLSQVNQMRFSMTKPQQSSALRNILLSSSKKVPKPDNHTKKSYNQNLMNFELNQILSSLLSDFDN